MANDRMWLIHRPTQKMALIAKNWGDDTWVRYTGVANPPYFNVEGLLQECGYSTDYYISYESEGWK